ncbi:hypothetical protein [Brevibacillus sp. MCWH]|uniref:hypothetical protein n=1 Tax=Brevibacillus sp. MCWH TaxID=2508871 RepID=UPI00149255FB|nr:hypothetical protein [Brevibacillus sp. MCWH]NNV03907.1 hypothetical protein [Brevibacillus sp. MCWH]
MSKKRHIWIHSEPRDLHDDNLDVIVTLPDRTRWWGTFFTFDNIESLRQKNKKTGECLSGTYFYAVNMIICEDASRETIEKVVDDLLEKGILDKFMDRISDVTSEIEKDEDYEEGFFYD